MANSPPPEILSDLIQLQDLDTEIAEADAGIARLPERRVRVGERVTTAAQAIEVERQALEDAELEQRRTEGELRDSEELVKRLEGQTGNVNSNQAYTALLREIEQAKQQGSSFEDRILELLERVDTKREALAQAEAHLKDMERHAKKEEGEIDERQGDLETKREELGAKRDSVASGVEAPSLELYRRISLRYELRIAVLAAKACTGCRMVIPAQRCMEIKNATDLTTCPQCDRIIVTEARMAEAHAAASSS